MEMLLNNTKNLGSIEKIMYLCMVFKKKDVR
jgi:hypothetical protein